jgi:hypothetical protein
MKWQTKAGEIIDVDDMSEAHAKNSLKLMMRLHQQNKAIISRLQRKVSDEEILLDQSEWERLANDNSVIIPNFYTEDEISESCGAHPQ